MKFKTGVLIVSDTAFRDPSSDKSASVLRDVFANTGDEQWDVPECKIVPDDILEIQRSVLSWTDGADPLNLIVTTGGTGFAIKDNTPEAVSPLLHKHAPGLVHGMLASSLTVTRFAIMSRPVAGVRNKTLIVTLPGSPKGAKENLEAIIKLLPHACLQISGADSRQLHTGGIQKLEKDAGVATQATSLESASKSGHSHHLNHHHHGHSHGSHKIPTPHTDPSTHPRSNDLGEGPTRRHRSSPYPMVSVDAALKLISDNVPSPATVEVSVDRSLIGCVLAEDVLAAESVPAFRASIVDGYAINVGAGQSSKGTFPVTMISHAQHAGPVAALQPGSIARITTGAPLPAEATSVVMVEDTVLVSKTPSGDEEAEIEILTDAIKPGENVREVGSDVQAGSVVLRKGEGITAAGGELGLIASVGTRTVKVYKKPRVGVLSTGDEIVPHDREGNLQIGEVRDTNRPTLLTAIASSGYDAVDLGIASDTPGALEEKLRLAFQQVDMVITSGGVSMGELDLLKPTIERALGGTIHFGRVSMKPGKPTTFATIPFLKDAATGHRGKVGDKDTQKVIFSLPGNPASAVVTFFLFVLPALHAMSGISPPGLPKILVTLDGDVKCDPARSEYHRVVVTSRSDGLLYATSTGGQRSSRIGSFKGANALLCLPAEEKTFRRGERVQALLMGDLVAGF